VGILILIVAAGAVGTFLGILTVIAKHERTTNRHQLLTNIPGSIALGAVICVLPGGLLYVVTDNLPLTGFGAALSGFVVAWLFEAMDH
jgi:membrane associated rhomboid family serine protease